MEITPEVTADLKTAQEIEVDYSVSPEDEIRNLGITSSIDPKELLDLNAASGKTGTSKAKWDFGMGEVSRFEQKPVQGEWLTPADVFALVKNESFEGTPELRAVFFPSSQAGMVNEYSIADRVLSHRQKSDLPNDATKEYYGSPIATAVATPVSVAAGAR